MLEIFNSDSLKKAIGAEILSNQNNFRDKVAKFVIRNKNASQTDYGNGFGNNRQLEPEKAINWVPDRFAPVGWKYQMLGTNNSYLNHPNKVNSQGFLYGMQV